MAEKDYKNTNMLPVEYATFFPGLRETALEYGYALALHGSLSRDMDIIAVPWVETPKPHLELVQALSKFLGNDLDDSFYINRREVKPHGRIAYIIPWGGGGYVDFSVVTPPIEGEVIYTRISERGNLELTQSLIEKMKENPLQRCIIVIEKNN